MTRTWVTGPPRQKAPRDAEALRLWRDEGLTLVAIAARFGISRERVRQIRNRELERERAAKDE